MTDDDRERARARWDDGLIARRAGERAAPGAHETAETEPGTPDEDVLPSFGGSYGGALRSRLDALHELVGLSRTRVEGEALAEAGRVLDEAAARQRLSSRHTVIALAGATGSGKSTLFNALAGVPVSETGLRRPTTSAPIALSWSEGAAGLLDRLAVPSRLRRRPSRAAPPTPSSRGSSSSTCPTTTRRSPPTATRSTGSSASSTP